MSDDADSTAQAETFDLSTLEYYQRIHARHTLMSRIALLGVIFGMLAWNMWLTQRNYQAIIINLDQARLAQSDLDDMSAQRMEKLDQRMQVVEAEIEAQKPAAAVASAR